MKSKFLKLSKSECDDRDVHLLHISSISAQPHTAHSRALPHCHAFDYNDRY
jgi:hypothetical protein